MARYDITIVKRIERVLTVYAPSAPSAKARFERGDYDEGGLLLADVRCDVTRVTDDSEIQIERCV